MGELYPYYKGLENTLSKDEFYELWLDDNHQCMALYKFSISDSLSTCSGDYAAMKGYLYIIKFLHLNGYLRKDYYNTIDIACEYGNLNIVKYLCELGYTSKDLFEIAIESENFNIIKYLTELGYTSSFAVDWFSNYNEDLHILKYLMAHKGSYKFNEIVYEIIQDDKIHLLLFLNGKLGKQNKYLKTEILKNFFPGFAYKELFSLF